MARSKSRGCSSVCYTCVLGEREGGRGKGEGGREGGRERGRGGGGGRGRGGEGAVDIFTQARSSRPHERILKNTYVRVSVLQVHHPYN